MELIDAKELLKHEAPAKSYSPEMLVVGKGHVMSALRHPEDGWRADAAEKRAAEAEATIRRLREALEKIERHGPIMGSTGEYRQGQLDILENVSTIASLALANKADMPSGRE